MDVSFEQTLVEAIEKSINLIDSGETERGKKLLNEIKDAINCMYLIKAMLNDN